MYFIFAVIFLLYGGLNYYIGLRGWQGIFSAIPFLPASAYWVIFWVVALSYLAGRLGEKYLPPALDPLLSITGSYWLGFMFYSFLLLLGIDIIRLINKFIPFIPAGLLRSPAAGLGVLLLICGIVLYGAWNARHPVVHHYDLKIAKQAGNLASLHIVTVSDLHLGTIMDDGRLAQMVDLVNAQRPDLILFAGDVIDENVERVIEQEMKGNLSKLRAKYGTYAVLGNHEYLGGHAAEAVKYLRESGVTVLRDSSVVIDNSINIVGRDDLAVSRSGRKRSALPALLSPLNPALPVIVLDHQPSRLQEPEEAGVDLQLSGHTHAGQMFPINLLTRRIFQDDFGLWQHGSFQIIVSSGFGTWGPPLRVGNKPEIVDLTLHFKAL